jgi:erythronate-4-phosphate dehydrogenase
MKIIVDENISFGKEAFSDLGDVILSHGRKISNHMLNDADALIVRSITNVNRELLKDTKVKFVGTATIGTDHVDLEYLKRNNIAFSSAAGCNSHAVKEYVFTALTSLYNKYGLSFPGKSMGIIGIGNIGSKIVRVAGKLGLKVFKNDPPLQKESGSDEYCTLEEALQCDIITFHVPLNNGGIYNTVHLLNESNLPLIKPGAILINSSRGPVVDNRALKERLKKNNDIRVVLDVWEDEPDFDTGLLSLIEIGSPHIAGYSLEGKVNGTTLVYEALCKHLNIAPAWQPTLPSLTNNLLTFNSSDTLDKQLFDIFNRVYPVNEDDDLMRKTIIDDIKDVGKYFDSLRKNYRLRRELNNYKVDNTSAAQELKEILEELRVTI